MNCALDCSARIYPQLKSGRNHSLVGARRQICRDDERDPRNVRAATTHTMSRCSRSWERAVAGVGLSLFACDGAAFAADLPLKAPVPYVSTAYDWNGWYVGAHAGVIVGSSNWSATQTGAGGPGV